MATSTMMGCGFFAIGAMLTNSMYHYGTTPRTLDAASVTTRPRISRSEAAERDLVVNLPGLKDDPGFDQFAGYLDPTDTKHIFYLYMESQSNPATDPVVFWSNGGKCVAPSIILHCIASHSLQISSCVDASSTAFRL
jgi:hypothetical protein